MENEIVPTKTYAQELTLISENFIAARKKELAYQILDAVKIQTNEIAQTGYRTAIIDFNISKDRSVLGDYACSDIIKYCISQLNILGFERVMIQYSEWGKLSISVKW